MRRLPTFPRLLALCGALAVLASPAAAQSQPPATGSPVLDRATRSAQEDLVRSRRELAALREKIAAEKLPLSRRVAALEQRLAEARRKLDETTRRLDERRLEAGQRAGELEARRAEKTYLSNLFAEYVRNFESRIHIAELQLYDEVLEPARRAIDAPDLPPARYFGAQLGVLDAATARLEEALGGTRFEGRALGPGGKLHQGRFVLVGPVALFAADDGAVAGAVEQRLGSLEPNVVPFQEPKLEQAASRLVAAGEGLLPFDPTLGNARKVEQTEDTLLEHIRKGGPVMIPILAMAAAALFVALWKWIQLARVPRPARRDVKALLGALQRRDYEKAAERARRLKGPEGEMLRAGLEHVWEAKELIEEVMFEKMLETRLRLQSMLSFIGIAAASAPLLGLLGTVTGIINTFKLITVFGTGDARTLSSGISEALITTEFGLIVAIPSLLLHAWLTRRTKRFVDDMEKSAVAFLNRIPSQPPDAEAHDVRQPAVASR
ncbi:MAG: hypothetical protein D6738_03955 [Acidobacteria bacterium]|nr:MAG: hypothetical protein D6738_03955 [Acidobacteriota bacterium]